RGAELFTARSVARVRGAGREYLRAEVHSESDQRRVRGADSKGQAVCVRRRFVYPAYRPPAIAPRGRSTCSSKNRNQCRLSSAFSERTRPLRTAADVIADSR